jgi:hypothetical protein
MTLLLHSYDQSETRTFGHGAAPFSAMNSFGQPRAISLT